MVDGAGRPGALKIWIMAARPRTLTAAAVPVCVGTAAAMAEHSFAPLPATAALLGALLIQIGTNFANDYSDAAKGADKERKGPTRVTQAGLVPPERMRIAIAVTFGLSVLCGVYLALVGGWPIVVIGTLSILAGLAYTGGPYPLGYHGLGDLFVFVFFGLAATIGTTYVQTLRITPLSVWVAIPMGCLTVAILTANNLRDIESDRRAGKGTLVARYGRRFGQIEYAAALLVPFAIPIILFASGSLRTAVLLPLLALPLVWLLLRKTLAPEVSLEEHLSILAGTSRLLLAYGLLLCLGIVL